LNKPPYIDMEKLPPSSNKSPSNISRIEGQ
jgi:hypothetical protein